MGFRVFAFSAVMLGLAAGQASAQYYAPGAPPPYGYGGGYGERPFGGQCDAVFVTPYGERRFVCPLERPRPLGVRCHCPRRDPYAPPAPGRVIP